MKKNVPTTQQDYLSKLLEEFRKKRLVLSEKIIRQKDLLSRKSSENWSAEKKKKVLNRLNSANQEFNQTIEIISKIEIQISQL